MLVEWNSLSTPTGNVIIAAQVTGLQGHTSVPSVPPSLRALGATSWTGAKGMEEDVVTSQQFLTGVHIV